eukprot:5076594-Karenia_brevis.AAC.1
MFPPRDKSEWASSEPMLRFIHGLPGSGKSKLLQWYWWINHARLGPSSLDRQTRHANSSIKQSGH